MKKQNIIFVILMVISFTAPCQTINWATLKKDDRHLVNVHTGIEYSAMYALGYGHQIRNRWFPLVVQAEYSFPSGSKPLDDFKGRIGAQIQWAEYHNFRFSTGIHGVFRRYGNDFVRLLNFGSDMSGVVGYYRKHWYVAGEVGFDKAIVTHFKHKTKYKEQFPGVTDGWYEPATGGNFYYGLQAGGSIKRYDIYLRAGKMITQDFKTTPLVPFYAQIGCNVRF